jgi:hypothetical protein
MARNVVIAGRLWCATRLTASAVGARSGDDYLVASQPGGIWFQSDDGVQRFAVIAQLPTEDEFAAASPKQLAEWFRTSKLVSRAA